MFNWMEMPEEFWQMVGVKGAKYTIKQNPKPPYNFTLTVEKSSGKEGYATDMVKAVEEYEQHMWEVL